MQIQPSQCFAVTAAHIWLFRAAAECFCRSHQWESMANSNPALLRTPSECRLVELCSSFMWLKKKKEERKSNVTFSMLYLQQNQEKTEELSRVGDSFLRHLF